jgi:hypothetical protein
MSQNPFSEMFQNMHSYDEHVECLDNHMSNYFKGAEISAFHEIISFDFHLDVYFIKPQDRDYNILLTSGMSLYPMTVPDEIEHKDYRFAELMVLLPKDLNFEMLYTGKEKNSWIISMLKMTARFPHHHGTFIGIGHSIQAREDGTPYGEETDFVGCVILPSITLPEDFTEVKCGDNKINIYSVFPVYKNELEYKVENKYSGFIDLLNKEKPREIIDNNRKNLIKKKNFWDRFK